MKKLIVQIIKFGIVGTIAFLIDYFLLWLLTDIFNIHYLISSSSSFIISLIINYLLSMHYVFKARDGLSKTNEFFIFCILSTIGLIINEVIMYIGVDILKTNYLIIKLFATFIVMVFNFITKKIFIEKASSKI